MALWSIQFSLSAGIMCRLRPYAQPAASASSTTLLTSARCSGPRSGFPTPWCSRNFSRRHRPSPPQQPRAQPRKRGLVRRRIRLWKRTWLSIPSKRSERDKRHTAEGPFHLSTRHSAAAVTIKLVQTFPALQWRIARHLLCLGVDGPNATRDSFPFARR